MKKVLSLFALSLAATSFAWAEDAEKPKEEVVTEETQETCTETACGDCPIKK